jgi:hypothetical protein
MGILRAGVVKAGLAIVLAATGLGLSAQSALADRGGGHGGGGGGRGGGGNHHGGGGGNHFHGGGSHFHGGARFVVRPGYYPGRYYYYAPAPYYYSPYYYPPAYYPPPVAYAPPVLPSMNSGYQYFCPASQAYYPQVLECTMGWMQVAPGSPPPG